jgi:hypothetical protein
MLADRAGVLTELDERAGAFTPEWINRNPSEDAGAALRQLFGEQMEAVVQRFDRWPDKAFTEFLNIAGIAPLPGVPAEVLLEFEVADDAPQSVLIGPGFQAGARPPGATALVIWVSRIFALSRITSWKSSGCITAASTATASCTACW